MYMYMQIKLFFSICHKSDLVYLNMDFLKTYHKTFKSYTQLTRCSIRPLPYNVSHVMRKPVMPNANNKGTDQPVHPHSLISTFVVHCLDTIIPLVSISEISSLCLASVAAQAGLRIPWSQTPKTGFLVTRLILSMFLYDYPYIKVSL